MEYLKIFTDFAESIEPLSDAECGRLFRAMLKYASSGAAPEFSGNERFIWPTAKQSIVTGTCGKSKEKHWNWKGGVTPQNQKQRSCGRYREWRTAVFSRDQYVCQGCHKRGGRLNAHHIEPWAEYPDRRFDVSNGITLCYECHRRVHGGK